MSLPSKDLWKPGFNGGEGCQHHLASFSPPSPAPRVRKALIGRATRARELGTGSSPGQEGVGLGRDYSA